MTVDILNRTVTAKPPRELVDFATRQVVNAKLHGTGEMRSMARELMVVPVVAQSVDDDFLPIDTLLHIVTRDLSPKGACLVHFEAIRHEKIALQMDLAHARVLLLARVIWCNPLGPFYGIGVEFLAKLNEFPQPPEYASLVIPLL